MLLPIRFPPMRTALFTREGWTMKNSSEPKLNYLKMYGKNDTLRYRLPHLGACLAALMSLDTLGRFNTTLTYRSISGLTPDIQEEAPPTL